MIQALVIVVWLLQLASIPVAAAVLVLGLGSATGAPQEAVAAALACAIAILPYCFARGLTEIALTARWPAKVHEPKPVVDPTRSTLGLGS